MTDNKKEEQEICAIKNKTQRNKIKHQRLTKALHDLELLEQKLKLTNLN